MFDAIEAAKKLLDTQVDAGKVHMFGMPFSEYQKVYKATNENIDGYMSRMNFQDKTKALTVLASGDHAFNLVYHGITKIDTFDTNKLTEYYALGLKTAAILALDYRDYLKFMQKIIDPNISIDELNHLIKKIIPFMSKKYAIFWQSLMEYNYQIQKGKLNPLNLFRMLLINIDKESLTIQKNTYLKDEESYNKMKENLFSTTITFQCCDCLALGSTIKNDYDFIFLSNIADYFSKSFGYFWGYSKLKEFESSLLPISKKDCLIALAYLIKYYIASSHKYVAHPILSSNVTKEDLTDERMITFPHISLESDKKVVEDGLILKRVC